MIVNALITILIFSIWGISDLISFKLMFDSIKGSKSHSENVPGIGSSVVSVGKKYRFS